ncbi:MAG: AP endonuclease [Clostridiales bacterium]|nr:AP endonuclease [Clostridiales bacterium]
MLSKSALPKSRHSNCGGIMKKSICIEKLFVDLPFYDRFDMVRKTGFDYVEFGSWEQHDVKRIKELLTENQLKLGCFSGDKDYNIIDPAHCREFLDYLQRSAEVAHELDCKNLVLHSNALAEEGRMCTSGNELSDRTKIAAATKNLLAAVEVAEDADLTLQLEPVSTYAKPGYYMTTSASAAEIIRVVDSPRLKLLYDIYHMQLMEGDLANTIRANADIIGYIHIGDVPGRHEPGTGEINYPFLKHLLVDELKFDGIFAFELSPLTTLDACVEAMHAF